MMKLLLVSVFLAIVPLINSHSSNYCKKKCPQFDPPFGTLHLPGPTKNSFYKCSYGVGILFRCPSGTNFNPKIQVCDWPRNARAVRCKGSPNYEPEGSGDDDIYFSWH